MVDWNRIRNAVEGQDGAETAKDALADADEDDPLRDDAWEDWVERRESHAGRYHERELSGQWYRIHDVDPPDDADPDEVWIESKALVDPAGLKTGRHQGGDE